MIKVYVGRSQSATSPSALTGYTDWEEGVNYIFITEKVMVYILVNYTDVANLGVFS